MVEILKGVIEKLILFSIAIVVIPLALLFLSLHGYFDAVVAIIWGSVSAYHRQVFGAVLAVMAVNVVLVAYVVSAYREKDADKID